MDFIDPSLLSLLPYTLLLGCIVGFLAGLLGVGGGTVLVPALYYIFKTQGLGGEALMHTALATSIATILPTGLSSSLAQIRRKAVDWDAVKLMAPGLVIGVVGGIFLVTRLDSTVLQFIFAFGLYGIAASIIFKKEAEKSLAVLKNRGAAFGFTFIFGVLSTLLGIGGAVLNVPYLNRAGWPLKTAIAAGSVLGVVVAIPAIIGYILTGDGGFGYIHVPAFLMIVPMSVLIAPFGVRASHALPVKTLKIVFACVLFAVATKMFFEVI